MRRMRWIKRALPLAALSVGIGLAGQQTTLNQAVGADVVSHYLAASAQQTADAGAQVISITAAVPHLHKEGTLTARRSIGADGLPAYEVVSFSGDNDIKKQVIARYLTADVDQHKAGATSLAINEDNYRFAYLGEAQDDSGHYYVLKLTPKHKTPGLFAGTLWLDEGTYLPVREFGKFAKSPSVFLKNISFDERFAIQEGAAHPAELTSEIQTRLFGPVHMQVTYADAQPVRTATAVQMGEELE